MTDQEKREIIKRVARNVRDFGYFDGTLDITEEVLDAANYFKLRKAAKTALEELRAYRRLNGVVPAVGVVDGPVERELEAALGGGGESQLPLIEIRDLQPTTPANGPE